MNQNAFRSGLLGLAVGDALGVPVEFRSRKELEDNPVRGMRGKGTHGQPPGTWSDDSSLTFCLAESLTHGYDLEDIADRFCRWLEEGYWAARGEVFDVGNTTAQAIDALRRGAPPTEAGGQDEMSNGNGSLMRILPMAFHVSDMEITDAMERVHDVSRITHGHPRSLVGCGIYVEIAVGLLQGLSPEDAYRRGTDVAAGYYQSEPFRLELGLYSRVIEGDLASLPEEDIRSSGYVVDTLEAGLWALLRSDSYREAVLTAVNLGGDTDTCGAVCGALAGLAWEEGDIPGGWLEQLTRREDIEDLAERLASEV